MAYLKIAATARDLSSKLLPLLHDDPQLHASPAESIAPHLRPQERACAYRYRLAVQLSLGYMDKHGLVHRGDTASVPERGAHW